MSATISLRRDPAHKQPSGEVANSGRSMALVFLNSRQRSYALVEESYSGISIFPLATHTTLMDAADIAVATKDQ